MKILVIGNGFDLAHGLKTTYSDFLEYLAEISQDRQGEYCDEFRWLDDEDWTRLFYERRHYLSGRWEGLEAEIKRIAEILYSAHVDNKGKEMPFIDAQSSSAFCYFDNAFTSGKNTNLKKPGHLEDLRDKMGSSLTKIIRLLEIYFAKEINTTPLSKRLKMISDYNPDKVLSFNYTNTYERLYGPVEEKNICYIHGKSELEHDIDEFNLSDYERLGYDTEDSYKAWLSANRCNMVLGIDEFQDSKSSQSDNYCIQFKKFYQRILKKTGSTYKDWLMDRNPTTDPELKIAFFGHSLDVMDKDIIAELVNTDKADVTIYYRNNDSLARYIQNLVAIIGEAPVIDRVHGKNATLHFVQQDNTMINI